MRSIRVHNNLLIRLLTMGAPEFEALCETLQIPYPVTAKGAA